MRPTLDEVVRSARITAKALVFIGKTDADREKAREGYVQAATEAFKANPDMPSLHDLIERQSCAYREAVTGIEDWQARAKALLDAETDALAVTLPLRELILDLPHLAPELDLIRHEICRLLAAAYLATPGERIKFYENE